MKQPRVVMVNFWMNETRRQLDARIEHLLSKTYPKLRWVWLVGDSIDKTEDRLWETARKDGRITIVRCDTGIAPTTADERCERASIALTAALSQIQEKDDFALIHESDLRTPTDICERFLAHISPERDIIAGWPELPEGSGNVFYDTWAYRANGKNFEALSPFHPVYKPDQLFEVDSVGSCWLFPAQAARNLVIEKWACVELCEILRVRALRIWVDPTIKVLQPRELFSPSPRPSH